LLLRDDLLHRPGGYVLQRGFVGLLDMGLQTGKLERPGTYRRTL